jgi:hypothetical protein
MNAGKFEDPGNAQSLHARAAFEASLAHLDADTRRRLRNARGYALQPGSQRLRPAWLLPAGAAFATALALIVFWPHASIPTPARTKPADGAATAAVTGEARDSHRVTADAAVDSVLADSLIGDGGDGADPELLGNLDFYDWLAKQPPMAPKGG